MKSKNNLKIKKGLAFKIAFVIFSIYTFTIFYSFGWGFVSAVREHTDFILHPFSFPESFHFENFGLALSKLSVETPKSTVQAPMLIVNSIWYTVGKAGLTVFSSACLAYVVSKYDFIGKKLIYGISVFMITMPVIGALPAQFKLYSKLGLIDSPKFLLSCMGGFGYNFILLFGFFESLSWSYAEACFIDGGNDWQCFFRVMMPQALPAIGSVFILQSISAWNDYETPLIFLKNSPTLVSGLYLYQNSILYDGTYPLLFAGLMLSAIPIIVLFVCFSDIIMRNTSIGGLKG